MANRYMYLILAVAVVLTAAFTPVAADDDVLVVQEGVDQPQPVESADTGEMVPQNASYEIQPEDILQVDVWGEPTLQKLQLQVTPDGFINVAYIGDINVVGLTAQQLSNIIAQKLVDAEILVNPKVQVTIISIHRLQIRVLGQVQRPGMVEVKDGDTVIEAIAQAGSYIPDLADLENATITRTVIDSETKEEIQQSEPLNLKAIFYKGDLSQNYRLRKGDIIYIPEDTKNKFYVMGEVLRPGQYQLRDNTTILSAIMQANGPTPRGAMKATVLIRGDQRVPIDMAKLIGKADVTQNVPLEPGDVVYVPETSKPDWNKISQVLSAITSLGYIRRFGLF